MYPHAGVATTCRSPGGSGGARIHEVPPADGPPVVLVQGVFLEPEGRHAAAARPEQQQLPPPALLERRRPLPEPAHDLVASAKPIAFVHVPGRGRTSGPAKSNRGHVCCQDTYEATQRNETELDKKTGPSRAMDCSFCFLGPSQDQTEAGENLGEGGGGVFSPTPILTMCVSQPSILDFCGLPPPSPTRWL